MRWTSLAVAVALALGAALSLHRQLDASVGVVWLTEPFIIFEPNTILFLEPFGPAMKAQVRVADRILAINGSPPERVPARDLSRPAARTYLIYRSEESGTGRARLLHIRLTPGNYTFRMRLNAWLDWAFALLILAAGSALAWNFQSITTAKLFWLLCLQWAVFTLAGAIFAHLNEAFFIGAVTWWQLVWIALAVLCSVTLASALVHFGWILSASGQRWLTSRCLAALYLFPILLALPAAGLIFRNLVLKEAGALAALISVAVHLSLIVIGGYFLIRGFQQPIQPGVPHLLSQITRGLVWIVAGKILELAFGSGIPLLPGESSQAAEWAFLLSHALALLIMARGLVKISFAFGYFLQGKF